MVDDWENADIDDVAAKIASKQIVPATAKGIHIKEEEEEEDLDSTQSTIKSNAKAQAKIKDKIKQ